MSAVHSLSSLTIPEQDMLAWYRLGSDPDQHSSGPIASNPAFDLPEAITAEPIQMPEAARRGPGILYTHPTLYLWFDPAYPVTDHGPEEDGD